MEFIKSFLLFIDATELAQINAGLETIERRTRFNGRDCIKFGRRTNETNYINVVRRENTCSSFVGMIKNNSSQELILGNGCATRAVVAHEFMHALGMWHEQSRYDFSKI